MARSERTILLDESHVPLLRGQAPEPETAMVDTWGTFKRLAHSLGFHVPVPLRERFVETLKEKPQTKTLVLGGPTECLTAEELRAVEVFLQDGGSLLLAINGESYWQLVRKGGLEPLTDVVGVRFGPYHNQPPAYASTIHPHFITAAVSRLPLWDAATLQSQDHDITPLVALVMPGGEKEALVLACLQKGHGRLVVSSDFAWLGDRFWDEAESPVVVRNMLRWLAFQNPIDWFDLRYEPRLRLGETGSISVTLLNPTSERLSKVRCVLQPTSAVSVEPVAQAFGPLPAGGHAWVQWSVTPREIGSHSFDLTVEAGGGRQRENLVFLNVAPFICEADGELCLRLLDLKGQTMTTSEVDQAFIAEGHLRWREGAAKAPVRLELSLSSPTAIHVHGEEQTPAGQRWTLIGRKKGDHEVRVHVAGTEQKALQRLRLTQTEEQQAQYVRETLLPRLEVTVQTILGGVRREFLDPDVTSIATRILTPEQYVKWVYPNRVAELMELLEAAQRERDRNVPLYQHTLQNIAPLYSVRLGACVPFAPTLGRRLGDLVRECTEAAADHFLTSDWADQVRLQQNLAAYLLHEKYGHGFFSTHTLIGQQLAILDRAGFLEPTDAQFLSRPYPRLYYERFTEAIELLRHSVIMVDEGLSAWVELRVLRKIGGEIGQGYDRRSRSLLEQNASLAALRGHPYFRQFAPEYDSKYREGFEKLEQISEWFGDDCGEKCAVQAVIKSGAVNLGLEELDRNAHFALTPRQMYDALLEDKEVHDARTDMRLKTIFEVLYQHRRDIREQQLRSECHRECRHDADMCPLDDCVHKTTGW